MQQEPQGSCGSLVDPLVSGLVKHPGAPVRRVAACVKALAQTPRAQACEGTSGGESRCDRPGMTCFGGGSEALEPRPWNQNWRAQVPWSPRSFQTSYSSEFEAVEHRGREGAAGAAMHHGLPVRKGVTSENPRSGSGPSVSARPEGEQPVEGAKNPEDGRCRARQVRHDDPSADVAEGAGNPRRGDPVQAGPGRASWPEP